MRAPNFISDVLPFCYRTDSYKVGHHGMYQPGQQVIHSYFESRGWGDSFRPPVDYGGVYGPKVVFFGLQYILKAYFTGVVITPDVIDEAEDDYALHFPYTDRKVFNREGFEYIVKEHGGRLPLRIRAVPEGTCLDPKNVLITVENTDLEHCAWLTNFVETHLVQTWYPCTVATQSREILKAMLAFQYKTGTPAEACAKVHDFGCRGVTCMEQAMIGGAAHLTSFYGTDTCPGFRMAKRYYGAPMAGQSVNATEHSVMASRNGEAGELAVMRDLLLQNPTGLVACVSDTYDIYRAVAQYWGDELKDEVMGRDGCLSIRPDSSGRTRDGTDESTIDVLIRLSHIIWEKFGGETNAKGFNVFDPHVRMIQGDGINYTTFVDILRALCHAKWSGDNIAFGSGGGLLQQLDRDTLQFAFKAIAGKAGGEWYDIWKDPYHGGKQSKRGRQKLVWAEVADGKYLTTVPESELGQDQLIDVFLNGDLLVDHALADVRRRVLPHPREVNATSERLGFGTITAEEWGDYVGTNQFKG